MRNLLLRPAFQNVLEGLVCLVGVVVLPLVVFYPTFLFGQVPLDTDSVFALPPWEGAQPTWIETPPDPASDLVAQRYYPSYAFLQETARRGDSILWSSMEGCGVPFLALWRSRCLSPFSIPFYVMPLDRALQMSMFLKFVVAALCAYYAARRFGFARAYALFVSVSFALSGFMIVNRAAPLGDVLPWLPLLFLYVERLAMGRFRVWPLGALIIGVMLLGGDPETVGGSLIFAAVCLFTRILAGSGKPAEAPRATAAFLVGIVLAVGLAAAQILPFIEFLTQAASGRSWAGGWPRISDLVTCFFPEYFGTVTAALAQQHVAGHTQAAGLFHVGLSQALLLPLWFALRQFAPPAQRQRVDPLLLGSLVITGLTLGIGYVGRHLELPVALRPENLPVQPQHLLPGNALVVAFAAAAAAEEWVQLNARECATTLKRLAVFLPVLALAIAAMVLLRRHDARPLAPGFGWQAAVAGGFSGALLALLAVTLFRPSPRLLGYALAALTFLQLSATFQPAITFREPALLFPETPFLAALREGDDAPGGNRVGGSMALQHWPLGGNEIPQMYLTGGGTPLRRYDAFVERLRSDPLLLRQSGCGLLLLTRDDIQGPFATIRDLLTVQSVFPSGAALFDDPDRKPRAWIAYAGRGVDGFDPAQLSSNLPPLIERIPAPQGGNPPDGAAPVVAQVMPPEANTFVRVRVERANAPAGAGNPPRGGQGCVLVLADAWYPGWRATVDGVGTPVGIVDGVFRGVTVSEGDHDVVFYYDPRSIKVGLGVSAAAAAVVAVGLVVYGVTRFRGIGLFRRDRGRR